MAAAAARIGPNAITRMADALETLCGGAMARRVFDEAGLSARLETRPETMVDEAEVIALHRAARALLPRAMVEAVARDAGVRTADYLLAHRIPGLAQRLLRLLPPALAARAFARAIARHAWTFAGSGSFSVRRGPPLAFVIRDGPVGRSLRSEEPVCGYFAATFEGLFRAIVHPDTQVREAVCQATGGDACVFEATWPSGLTRRRRAAWPPPAAAPSAAG